MQGTSNDSNSADERLDGEHYDAILDAVMETARGRWFLEEFANRKRAADTETVMTALSRLEKMMEQQGEKADQQRIRTDLLDMIAVIARTRAEIASMRPDSDGNSSLSVATTELELIVSTTEQATSDILAAAEDIQEQAWKLREAGVSPAICDALDARATDIFTGCSFQDLTGQRIGKVVHTLQFIEERVNAMMSIWGGIESFDEVVPVAHTRPSDGDSPMHGPPLPDEDGLSSQEDIDALFD